MNTQTPLFGKTLLGGLYVCIAVAIIATAMLAVFHKNSPHAIVVLGGEEVSVIIADTPTLREQGLSGYKKIKQTEGMLFVFETLGNYGFWMKDMNFPIDIIWFDENRKIVDVWENATPESYPAVRAPSTLTQYVLEVNTGFYKNHALKKGDKLEL